MAKDVTAKAFQLQREADGYYRTRPPADSTPPSLNGPITFSNVTTTGFTVNFPAASDAQSGVASYNVRAANNSEFSGATTYTTTNLSLGITNLPAGTWYVAYRAVDGAGNASPWSAGGVQTISSSTGLRWAPGHYVRFGNGDSLSSVLAFIDSEANTANLTGFLTARWWAELETSPGVYNIGPSSPLGQIVARCEQRGKKLIIRVQDKKFGSTNPSGALPDYLTDQGLVYSRTTPGLAVGAAHWREASMTAYINLYKALAAQYASSPAVVAFGIEESVYGQNLPADYSASGLTTQLIRALQEIRAVAPRQWFICKTNWINGDDANKTQMRRFFAAARADRGTLVNGGPDVLVNSTGSSGTSDGWNVMIGAVGGIDHRGDYAIWANTDIDDFNRGASPATIAAKAITTGEANIMTWLKVGANGFTYLGDMKPYIQANPIPHTSVPTQHIGLTEAG